MIIVMSDSHTERTVIEDIKTEYLDKASAIIHCGDSELPVNDLIWSGITVVGGNCDYDPEYKDYQSLEVENQHLLVTHGHLQGLSGWGEGRLFDFAAEQHADILCFGHIHRPVCEIRNGCLCINPGSVAQPRGDWKEKMYTVIEIFEDSVHKNFKISYRNLKHEPIKGLQLELEMLK
ncbi:MAG: metallophosphoesterase [Streptococcaceae bacterium]|jgi:putative phosphoesterase|nr:metallophosphoesterase [Streptococcaceae bacterium]